MAQLYELQVEHHHWGANSCRGISVVLAIAIGECPSSIICGYLVHFNRPSVNCMDMWKWTTPLLSL